MPVLRRVETIVVVALVVLATVFFLAIHASLVVYSPSPSVGHQLFLRVFRAPGAGDFVVFCAPADASRLLREHGYPSHPLCAQGRVRLVKRVEAVAGGRVFVLGSHPRSVDSRTFGWIPASEAFTVVPIDGPKGERDE